MRRGETKKQDFTPTHIVRSAVSGTPPLAASRKDPYVVGQRAAWLLGLGVGPERSLLRPSHPPMTARAFPITSPALRRIPSIGGKVGKAGQPSQLKGSFLPTFLAQVTLHQRSAPNLCLAPFPPRVGFRPTHAAQNCSHAHLKRLGPLVRCQS